jgi:dephospho-CoA kinase
MLRIGLTGLMASGKSTVGRRFQERGAHLVDGDALGWDVLRRPATRDAIAAEFGAAVLDSGGAIDRGRLGRIVFRDPASMGRLNAIVQPALLAAVRAAMDAPGEGIRVLDAAMLSAWRLEPELDGVVEVIATQASRIARLRAARGFTEEEARERILGQTLPPVRGARRLWSIENVADRAELGRRCDAVWNEIESLGRQVRPS